MPEKDAETIFRELSSLVIQLHKKDTPTEDIAKAIELLGIEANDSLQFVEEIIEAHKKGIDLSKKPTFLDKNPVLREIVYFAGGIALVLIGVVVLTFVLRVANTLFDSIGLGEIGEILLDLGSSGAGMLLGVLGTAASRENKSIGMIIGCWVGAGIYYWWLFSLA